MRRVKGGVGVLEHPDVRRDHVAVTVDLGDELVYIIRAVEVGAVGPDVGQRDLLDRLHDFLGRVESISPLEDQLVVFGQAAGGEGARLVGEQLLLRPGDLLLDAADAVALDPPQRTRSASLAGAAARHAACQGEVLGLQVGVAAVDRRRLAGEPSQAVEHVAADHLAQAAGDDPAVGVEGDRADLVHLEQAVPLDTRLRTCGTLAAWACSTRTSCSVTMAVTTMEARAT